MAVAYVNSTAANWSGTTGVIAVPSGTSDGHLMFLSVASAGSTSWAITGGGWTQLYGNNQTQLVWYRIASSEPVDYTLTWSGSGSAGATMTVFSGQDSDPIMAWRQRDGPGANGAETQPHATQVLYFQTADFMAFSSIIHRSATGMTAPSTWTAASQGTGSVRSGSAYKSFSATAGLAATSWTDAGGSHSTNVFTCAIRPSGVTALSLKASASTAAGAVASFGANLPVAYAVGDLIVALHGIRDLNPATARTLSAANYTVEGSQQNYTSGTQIVASTLYRRIATGSDTLTCASSVTPDTHRCLTMAFSTGSSGDDPAILPTTAQQVDSVSDTTHNVPAMTLADYAEDNILIAGLYAQGPGGATAAPAGYEYITSNIAGGASDGQIAFAVKMNSGANPAAATFTGGNAGISETHHLAVGVGLVGAGAYSFGQILIRL